MCRGQLLTTRRRRRLTLTWALSPCNDHVTRLPSTCCRPGPGYRWLISKFLSIFLVSSAQSCMPGERERVWAEETSSRWSQSQRKGSSTRSHSWVSISNNCFNYPFVCRVPGLSHRVQCTSWKLVTYRFYDSSRAEQSLTITGHGVIISGSGNSEHSDTSTACPGPHQVNTWTQMTPGQTGQYWAGLLLQSQGLKARPTRPSDKPSSDDDEAYKIFLLLCDVAEPAARATVTKSSQDFIRSELAWSAWSSRDGSGLRSARAFSGLWWRWPVAGSRDISISSRI